MGCSVVRKKFLCHLFIVPLATDEEAGDEAGAFQAGQCHQILDRLTQCVPSLSTTLLTVQRRPLLLGQVL